MATHVGSVFVNLGAKTDRKGFDEYQARVVKAQQVKDISARLGAEVDERGFDQYQAKLAEVRAKTALRDAYKVSLKADYDGRAFRAWQSDLRKAAGEMSRAEAEAHKMNNALLRTEQQSRRTNRETHALSGVFGALRTGTTVLPRALTGVAEGLVNLAEGASRAGGSIGGAGGGLIGGLGALAGGMAGLVGIAGAVGAVLISLVGALTALASSAVAAVAGIAAIGVAAAAAAGPLAALAGAVGVRFAAIAEAYQAVGKEADKSGAAATTHAQAQKSAAQQVKSAEQGLADAQRTTQKAQENLTDARFKARREVQDLAAAVKHAALDEEGASLSLDEALKRLAEVQADPKSSQLDIHEAQFAVKQANQGIKDAHQARGRADTDRKKGTDTVKQAEDQLATAMRAQARAADGVAAAQTAAQTATEKQGGAADDAQAKLANLDATERHLLGTFKTFADSLSGLFRPATDAIFSGVDKALGRLGPLILRFKGRFTDLGKSIGGIIDDASKNLAGPEWGRALDAFIATSQKIVKPISDSVGSVLVILRNIAVAAQPYVVDLANGIRDALGGLAGKTNDAKGLSGVIKGLVGQARSWAGLMGSVAKFFYLVFNGSKDDGKTLVDTLKKIVDHWNHFLGTKDGQRRMHDFFKDSVEFAKKLFGWIGDVAGALLNLSLWVQHNGPGFIDFFKRHKGLMEAIAIAAVTFKTAMVVASGVKLGAAALAILTGGRVGVPGGGVPKGAAGGAAAEGAGAARGVGIRGLAKVAGKAGAVAAAIDFAINLKDSKGNPIAATINSAHDLTFGIVPKVDAQAGAKSNLSAFQKQIHDLASHDNVKGLQDVRKELDLYGKFDAPGGIKKAKSDLDKLIAATKEKWAERWGHTLDSVEKDTDSTFGLMRKNTAGHLTDIKTAVETNTAVIKQRLRDDPEAGRKALAHTFRSAAAQIQESMDAGKISTSTGTKEIRRLMIAALKQLGFTESQADLKLGSGLRHGQVQQDASQRQPGQNAPHARGGWIGARGMVSDDVVPIAPGAVAAYGEYDAHGPGGQRAILNRHQAPFADMMLAAGGYPGLDQLPAGHQLPVLEQALGPMGGLDGLFGAITRPHYLARGGRFASGGVAAYDHTYPAHHTGTPGIALSPDVVMAIAQSQGLPGRAFEQIAHGESSYMPGIVEWPPEADGAQGYGLWQLTTGHVDAAVVALINRLGGWAQMLNPVKNAKAAKALFDIGGLGRWHGTRFLGVAGSADASASRASAAAAPVAVPKIIGPITKIAGGIGALVQRGYDVTTSAANSQLKRLAAMAPSGAPGGTPGATSGPAGTTVFKGITMAKWVAEAMRYAQSKGVESQPTSGYRPGFDPHTASGASEHQGLQYPHGAVDFGSFTSGLGPKMAVVNATRDFKWPLLAPIGFHDDGHASGTGHARGGLLGRAIRRFAGGGKIKPSKKKIPGLDAATNRKINLLDGYQGVRIPAYDAAVADVAGMQVEYTRQERRFNLFDEPLIDDNGLLNVYMVNRRAAEIQRLIDLAVAIRDRINDAYQIAKRVVSTYRTIIAKLTASLKHTKGKNRAGVRAAITAYKGELGTFVENRDKAKGDLFDANTDLIQLRGEKAEVLATKAAPPDATPADSSVAGDTSTPEPVQLPPTAADIAAAALADLATFQSGRRDLLTQFGRNFVTPFQAAGPGGAFSGAPDELTAAAGVRAFGATGSGGLGGLAGGSTVIANFASAPPSAPTFISQVRYLVENGAS